MVLVNFKGCTVSNEIRTMIETYYVGNIMLSSNNIQGMNSVTRAIMIAMRRYLNGEYC